MLAFTCSCGVSETRGQALPHGTALTRCPRRRFEIALPLSRQVGINLLPELDPSSFRKGGGGGGIFYSTMQMTPQHAALFAQRAAGLSCASDAGVLNKDRNITVCSRGILLRNPGGWRVAGDGRVQVARPSIGGVRARSCRGSFVKPCHHAVHCQIAAAVRGCH